jgi:hypothetical protein
MQTIQIRQVSIFSRRLGRGKSSETLDKPRRNPPDWVSEKNEHQRLTTDDLELSVCHAIEDPEHNKIILVAYRDGKGRWNTLAIDRKRVMERVPA